VNIEAAGFAASKVIHVRFRCPLSGVKRTLRGRIAKAQRAMATIARSAGIVSIESIYFCEVSLRVVDSH
jgi:hypothetical protein